MSDNSLLSLYQADWVWKWLNIGLELHIAQTRNLEVSESYCICLPPVWLYLDLWYGGGLRSSSCKHTAVYPHNTQVEFIWQAPKIPTRCVFLLQCYGNLIFQTIIQVILIRGEVSYAKFNLLSLAITTLHRHVPFPLHCYHCMLFSRWNLYTVSAIIMLLPFPPDFCFHSSGPPESMGHLWTWERNENAAYLQLFLLLDILHNCSYLVHNIYYQWVFSDALSHKLHA